VGHRDSTFAKFALQRVSRVCNGENEAFSAHVSSGPVYSYYFRADLHTPTDDGVRSAVDPVAGAGRVVGCAVHNDSRPRVAATTKPRRAVAVFTPRATVKTYILLALGQNTVLTESNTDR
jgi:hypothetical protein